MATWGRLACAVLGATWMAAATVIDNSGTAGRRATRNDAQALLSLLQPALARSDRVPPPVLIVVGNPRWLGAFLEAVEQAMAVVVVLGRPTSTSVSPRLFQLGAAQNAYTVAAEDRPEDLVQLLKVITGHTLTQLLVWGSSMEEVVTRLSQSINPSVCYLKPVHIVVSEMGDGARLFMSFHTKAHLKRSVIREVDRWTPEKGRLRQVGIWLPCLRNYTALAFSITETDDYSFVKSFTDAVLEHVPAVPVPQTVPDWEKVAQELGPCPIDLLVLRRPISRVGLRFTMYPWGSSSVVALVPVGLGRPCLVDGVIGEFSAPLWLATWLCCLAAGLGLLLLGGRSVSFLDALAPLLGQPPTVGARSERASARQSLLGSWLLVCVVLSSAYTGRLLTFLVSKCSTEDIASVEGLLGRNLTLYLQGDFLFNPHYLPENETLKSLEVGTLLHDILDDVAYKRQAAIVASMPTLMPLEHIIAPFDKQIHRITSPTGFFDSLFLTKKGSPIEPRLSRTLGRFRAAGIGVGTVVRFRHREDMRLYRAISHWQRTRPASAPEPAPLALRTLQAGFWLLGVGLIAATVALIVELATYYLASAGKMHP